jgi:hypothetical protein
MHIAYYSLNSIQSLRTSGSHEMRTHRRESVYVFAVGQVGALSLFDGIWIYFAVSLEEKVRKFVYSVSQCGRVQLVSLQFFHSDVSVELEYFPTDESVELLLSS